jgi:hypothetical protein
MRLRLRPVAGWPGEVLWRRSLSRSKAVCAHVYTARLLPARGRSRGPYGKGARRDTRSSVVPIAAAILVGDAVDTINGMQVRVDGATQSSGHLRSGGFCVLRVLGHRWLIPTISFGRARDRALASLPVRTDMARSDLGPGLAHDLC